jgi:addiction module RelE/StbE family toxin
MVEIRWTDFAIENLINIGDYIEQDSAKYAEIVVNKIFDATEILEQHPFAGRIVPEFSKEHIRELIYGSYRIIYTIVSKDAIDIITIHHSARLLSKTDLWKKMK